MMMIMIDDDGDGDDEKSKRKTSMTMTTILTKIKYASNRPFHYKRLHNTDVNYRG